MECLSGKSLDFPANWSLDRYRVRLGFDTHLLAKKLPTFYSIKFYPDSFLHHITLLRAQTSWTQITPIRLFHGMLFRHLPNCPAYMVFRRYRVKWGFDTHPFEKGVLPLCHEA